MWDHWFMGNRWKMRSMGARRGCDGWRAKGSRAVCLQLAGGGGCQLGDPNQVLKGE